MCVSFLSYLIQVSVAPRLSISEDSGNDSPLTVVLPFLRGRTPLKAGHLPGTGHQHTEVRVSGLVLRVFPAKLELAKLAIFLL